MPSTSPTSTAASTASACSLEIRAATPFDAAGELDEAAVRAQVRWLLDAGVHGLAAGGSTGEGQTLDQDELRRLVGAIAEEAAGRVPVIAGIIIDSTRDAIRRGEAVEGLGVAALQVTPGALPVPARRRRHARALPGRGGRDRPADRHLQRCPEAICRRRSCAGSWPRCRA